VFGSFASTLSTFLSDVDVAIVVGQQRCYNTTTTDNRHKRWRGDALSEDRSSERSVEQSAGGKFFGDTPLGRTGLDCIEAWQSGVSDSSSSSSSSSSSGDDSSDSGSEAEEEFNAKTGNSSSGNGSSSNAKSGNSSSSVDDGSAQSARYATAVTACAAILYSVQTRFQRILRALGHHATRATATEPSELFAVLQRCMEIAL
jgi:hypothetical protein